MCLERKGKKYFKDDWYMDINNVGNCQQYIHWKKISWQGQRWTEQKLYLQYIRWLLHHNASKPCHMWIFNIGKSWFKLLESDTFQKHTKDTVHKMLITFFNKCLSNLDKKNWHCISQSLESFQSNNFIITDNVREEEKGTPWQKWHTIYACFCISEMS